MSYLKFDLENFNINRLKMPRVIEFLDDLVTRNGRTAIQIVHPLPVSHLEGRAVAIRVTFSNKTVRWALISNVNVRDKLQNEHFLAISFCSAKKWFHLARYFDHDYAMRGPHELSKFLGLAVTDIFPIRYHLTTVAAGPVSVLKGTIKVKPRNRLSRSRLIAMALPELPPEWR